MLVCVCVGVGVCLCLSKRDRTREGRERKWGYLRFLPAARLLASILTKSKIHLTFSGVKGGRLPYSE